MISIHSNDKDIYICMSVLQSHKLCLKRYYIAFTIRAKGVQK